MLHPSWLGFQGPTPRAATKQYRRHRRPSCRLSVERLEDRCLLSGFNHLDPGGPVNLREEVPVNFVFVGYEADQVNEAQFRASLPAEYDPVVRSRLWYGVTEYLGLHYTYDYRITFADTAFEDSFFAALRELAAHQPQPTMHQQLYNQQENNVLEVTENYLIDAPSVEKWLAANAQTLAGVNTRHDTVFFINWWGRGDFIFHGYTKTGEPDPDTGVDLGVADPRREALTAWGGTTADDEETGLGPLGTHRIWFHDLSAGPIFWDDGWNVDDADLDGDSVADYRIPPVWEYLTPGGKRAPIELTGDLAKLARYVAIDMYFTASPQYPPYLTPDRLPDAVNLDVNTYEGIRGVDASETLLDPQLLVQELSELYRVPMSFDHQDLAFRGESRTCWVKHIHGVPCHTDHGNTDGFANLFYDAALKLDNLLDGPAGAQHDTYVYEAVAVNYAVPDHLAHPLAFGLDQDNFRDGTQSFSFSFVWPEIAEFGFGLTATVIHEYGHQFGLGHPHDGFDAEVGDFVPYFGPTGDFYFAWTGDQVNSIMGYLWLNWDFSQFDRDNANRFFAAAYIRSANNIAEDILALPRVPRTALRQLRHADAEVGLAKAALAEHDYIVTFNHAKRAYRHVLRAAHIADVEVLPSNNGWTILPSGGGTGGSGSGRGRLASHDGGLPTDSLTMPLVELQSVAAPALVASISAPPRTRPAPISLSLAPTSFDQLFDARVTLAQPIGRPLWLDQSAADWGWFVDPTPWDDSEFSRPGDQGEQNRMDLLTVLAHEVGHLLGYDHEQTGVMEDTLPGHAANAQHRQSDRLACSHRPAVCRTAPEQAATATLGLEVNYSIWLDDNAAVARRRVAPPKPGEREVVATAVRAKTAPLSHSSVCRRV